MDTSYNPASLNLINYNLKLMTLEYTSQEKSLIHQYHAYFSVLFSAYIKPQNFREAWHTEDTKDHEGWRTSI